MLYLNRIPLVGVSRTDGRGQGQKGETSIAAVMKILVRNQGGSDDHLVALGMVRSGWILDSAGK